MTAGRPDSRTGPYARRVLVAGLVLLVAGPVLGSTVAWLLYVAGNGLVAGAWALGTVPLVLVAAPALAVGGRPRAIAGAVQAVALAFDLAFAAVRVSGVAPGPFPTCIDGDCAAGAPWLARLVREDESVLAGDALVQALGILTPEARAELDAAAVDAYARLAVRTAGPGANALLLRSRPDRIESVAWFPPGGGPVPGIVYLHGFGGLLTPYLGALTEDPRLAGYAIVAPALGFAGEWWTDDGLAVVRRTLDTLPPRVDRDRLYLVGLSNGAVGATAVAADPALSGRFCGVVGLMGGSGDFGAPRVPTLLVAAEKDDRFPLGYLRGVHRVAASGGPAELVVVPGDHFALLTETASVDAALVGWLSAR